MFFWCEKSHLRLQSQFSKVPGELTELRWRWYHSVILICTQLFFIVLWIKKLMMSIRKCCIFWAHFCENSHGKSRHQKDWNLRTWGSCIFSDLRNATAGQMRIFSVLMFGNTKFFALFLPLADRELRAPFFGTKGKNIFGTKRLRKQSWNLFQVNLVPNPFFEKFIPDENSV